MTRSKSTKMSLMQQYRRLRYRVPAVVRLIAFPSERQVHSQNGSFSTLMLRHFKPSIRRLLLPVLLLILAVLPAGAIRVLVFETLAYPFGNSLHCLRYIDMPRLKPEGALVVAAVWAAFSYLIICLFGLAWSKLSRACPKRGKPHGDRDIIDSPGP